MPAIDKDMLKSLLDNFEKVMAEGPNLKKKHLLDQLVKKVLIHSRQAIEIWHILPNTRRFADCNIWLPVCTSMRTRRMGAETEVHFRLERAASDGRNVAQMGISFSIHTSHSHHKSSGCLSGGQTTHRNLISGFISASRLSK